MKIKLRYHSDGSVSIARENKEAIKHLNKYYKKLDNRLKWFPLVTNENNINNLLADFSSGCYIIGKGKSLDYVTKETFKINIPVICINHSIKVINELNLDNKVIGSMLDKDKEPIYLNYNCDLLVSYYSNKDYKNRDNKFILENTKFQSSIEAILEYLTSIKCPIVYMIGFDYIVSGDTDYANKLNLPENKKANYTSQPQSIKNFTDRLDINFISVNHENKLNDKLQP